MRFLLSHQNRIQTSLTVLAFALVLRRLMQNNRRSDDGFPGDHSSGGEETAVRAAVGMGKKERALFCSFVS